MFSVLVLTSLKQLSQFETPYNLMKIGLRTTGTKVWPLLTNSDTFMQTTIQSEFNNSIQETN